MMSVVLIQNRDRAGRFMIREQNQLNDAAIAASPTIVIFLATWKQTKGRSMLMREADRFDLRCMPKKQFNS